MCSVEYIWIWTYKIAKNIVNYIHKADRKMNHTMYHRISSMNGWKTSLNDWFFKLIFDISSSLNWTLFGMSHWNSSIQNEQSILDIILLTLMCTHCVPFAIGMLILRIHYALLSTWYTLYNNNKINDRKHKIFNK